tara:strand:- start:533 stop:733 length:201 start_codon:yes stop_codon:yes gene_type:complete
LVVVQQVLILREQELRHISEHPLLHLVVDLVVQLLVVLMVVQLVVDPLLTDHIQEELVLETHSLEQ